MKKVTAALTVLLALTLTGCAGGGFDASDEPTATPEATVEAVDEDQPDVSEPVEAAPLEVTAPPAPEVDTTEDIRGEWWSYVGQTLSKYGYGYPEMEDALPVGQLICDQARAGAAPENIVAIEGLIEGHESVNESIVEYTLTIDWALPPEQIASGETIPDYCGVLFPPA